MLQFIVTLNSLYNAFSDEWEKVSTGKSFCSIETKIQSLRFCSYAEIILWFLKREMRNYIKIGKTCRSLGC